MPTLSEIVKQEKRQHIVYSAMAVFSEMGYAESTIKDITKRAGISNGALFVYFENKRDILCEITRQNLGIFCKRVGEITDASDDYEFADVVEQLLELVRQISLSSGRALSLHVWSAAMVDRKIMDVLQENLNAIVEALAKLVAKYVQAGDENTRLSIKRITTGLFCIFIPGYIIQILMFGPMEPKAYMSAHRSVWALK